MPFNTNTLSFALTYGGTLIVVLLMFTGQLTAVGILLVVAGITRLPAYPIRAIARSFSRPDLRWEYGPRRRTGTPVSLLKAGPWA